MTDEQLLKITWAIYTEVQDWQWVNQLYTTDDAEKLTAKIVAILEGKNI